MGVQVHLINPESGEVEFIESYDSLGEALEETRELWMEEERGEQTFLLSNEATGRMLATMTRPDVSDPELCLTTSFEPGGALVLTALHRCRYVTGPDGYYLRTEVTRVIDCAECGARVDSYCEYPSGPLCLACDNK